MLIAQEKRKENISEYILYLYQVESLIRAYQLNMELINKNLVSNYQADMELQHKISEWYRNLVLMMEKEGKQEKGHLQFVINLINDLNEFHMQLIAAMIDSEYVSAFNSVKGLIDELKQKNQNTVNDVQAAFDGIYGYLLLKLSNNKVSEQTRNAIERISSWLGYLSTLFHGYESGELDIFSDLTY